MIPRTGYSRLQIFLHWAVALLFLCQFLFSDAMNQAARAVRHGTEPVVDAMVWQHILFGVLVLGFALWRLSLRREGGAAPAEHDGSALQELAARLTHAGLYLTMILLPVSGLAAWFGGVEAAGTAHQLAKMAFIAFFALHVVGAAFNQFWLRNGLIWRMVRAGR